MRTGPERKHLWQADCFDLYHVIPLVRHGDKYCNCVADEAVFFFLKLLSDPRRFTVVKKRVQVSPARCSGNFPVREVSENE